MWLVLFFGVLYGCVLFGLLVVQWWLLWCVGCGVLFLFVLFWGGVLRVLKCLYLSVLGLVRNGVVLDVDVSAFF